MYKESFRNARIVLTHMGIKVFIKRTLAFSSRVFFLSLPQNLKLIFAKKISRFKSDNIDSVINYTFSVLGGLIRPMQIREEFKDFLTLFKEKSPELIVEIGTAYGGSLFALCKLAPENAFIISIDLPGGAFGDGYPEWKTPIYKYFKKEKQELILLREDSHLDKSLNVIKELLNNKKIDFLFIDGDHSYEGVKQDFEMYSPLVKQGGVIAFHDVAPNGIKEFAGGVPIFWKEIKNKYEHKEFVKDIKQLGYGIGCLFV